jgi:hypothetical protein
VHERPAVHVVHVSVVEPHRLESYASTQIGSAGSKEQEGEGRQCKEGMKIVLFQIVPDLAPGGDEGRVSLVERDVGVTP